MPFAFTGVLFNLKLAYIILAFYLTLALSNIMSKNEYSKERNSFLMSGLNGLFAGWLLGRGFGANSVAFSGILYIILSYITIWAAEALLRPVLEVFEAALGSEADMAMEVVLPDLYEAVIYVQATTRARPNPGAQP